jgi:hypothetical protein
MIFKSATQIKTYIEYTMKYSPRPYEKLAQMANAPGNFEQAPYDKKVLTSMTEAAKAGLVVRQKDFIKGIRNQVRAWANELKASDPDKADIILKNIENLSIKPDAAPGSPEELAQFAFVGDHLEDFKRATLNDVVATWGPGGIFSMKDEGAKLQALKALANQQAFSLSPESEAFVEQTGDPIFTQWARNVARFKDDPFVPIQIYYDYYVTTGIGPIILSKSQEEVREMMWLYLHKTILAPGDEQMRLIGSGMDDDNTAFINYAIAGGLNGWPDADDFCPLAYRWEELDYRNQRYVHDGIGIPLTDEERQEMSRLYSQMQNMCPGRIITRGYEPNLHGPYSSSEFYMRFKQWLDATTPVEKARIAEEREMMARGENPYSVDDDSGRIYRPLFLSKRGDMPLPFMIEGTDRAGNPMKYYMLCLNAKAALLRWGGEMQHCVGVYNYDSKISADTCRIYQLCDEFGNGHITLEMVSTIYGERGTEACKAVQQSYGKGNRPPASEALRPTRKWAETINVREADRWRFVGVSDYVDMSDDPNLPNELVRRVINYIQGQDAWTRGGWNGLTAEQQNVYKNIFRSNRNPVGRGFAFLPLLLPYLLQDVYGAMRQNPAMVEQLFEDLRAAYSENRVLQATFKTFLYNFVLTDISSITPFDVSENKRQNMQADIADIQKALFTGALKANADLNVGYKVEGHLLQNLGNVAYINDSDTFMYYYDKIKDIGDKYSEDYYSSLLLFYKLVIVDNKLMPEFVEQIGRDTLLEDARKAVFNGFKSGFPFVNRYNYFEEYVVPLEEPLGLLDNERYYDVVVRSCTVNHAFDELVKFTKTHPQLDGIKAATAALLMKDSVDKALINNFIQDLLMEGRITDDYMRQIKQERWKQLSSLDPKSREYRNMVREIKQEHTDWMNKMFPLPGERRLEWVDEPIFDVNEYYPEKNQLAWQMVNDEEGRTHFKPEYTTLEQTRRDIVPRRPWEPDEDPHFNIWRPEPTTYDIFEAISTCPQCGSVADYDPETDICNNCGHGIY